MFFPGIRSTKKIGAAPGTLVHVGERRAEKVRISLIRYTENTMDEYPDISPGECCIFPEKAEPGIIWIHVRGLHESGIIHKIGECFRIHPLVLEDVLNTVQRPKSEEYEECFFTVLKSIRIRGEDIREIIMEQVSILIGKDFVISFQESEDEIFGQVYKRLRSRMGRIRRAGSDYLAYAIMDTVTDHYFSVIEMLEEEMESIEENLIHEPDTHILEGIYHLKRQIIRIRKSVLPLREMALGLERSESEFIRDTTRIYLRDLYDHVIQIADSFEHFREMSGNLLDLYHSSVSNRMNEVMKVLTIISTIFIPLGFIAGVYGMNFKYMPELEFRWGYFMVWGLIVTVFGSMILFFRKKRWI
ncbi:MAG: magnesium/cobalt transporter CorA [Desulfococcaceae bacterium]|jgi:magnesium transporter|nr:magnesium/cobalt transporter CorA [Desulfococcaceae bacterium]